MQAGGIFYLNCNRGQVNELINHLIVTICSIYISHILSYHYPLNKPIHCDKPNCNDKNEAQ